MTSKIFFVFLFFFLCYSNAQRDRKFFRKDYKYIESTQAFYKHHTLPRNWTDAYQACKLEGADFFYPEDVDEANAVLSFWNDTMKLYDWTFIGISDLIAEGYFETIDGITIENVYNRWHSGEPNNNGGDEDCVGFNTDGVYNDDSCSAKYPFFCKKRLSTLEWDTLCDMPFSGYTFDHVSKNRCYKFHNNAVSWTDAYLTCIGEQSYLAVINSANENSHLVNLTVVARDLESNVWIGTIHLGYHNRLGMGWKTTTGITPNTSNSGYNAWAEGQPDGRQDVAEKCGGMSDNGLLYAVRCDTKSFFICEHNVDVDRSQDYLSNTPPPE